MFFSSFEVSSLSAWSPVIKSGTLVHFLPHWWSKTAVWNVSLSWWNANGVVIPPGNAWPRLIVLISVGSIVMDEITGHSAKLHKWTEGNDNSACVAQRERLTVPRWQGLEESFPEAPSWLDRIPRCTCLYWPSAGQLLYCEQDTHTYEICRSN